MANRERDGPTRFEWERAVRDSDLPAPSKLLALTLGTHTGSKCRRPFASIGTLAEETSLGRSTVLKHLNVLTEEDGRFVQKRKRRDKVGRQTSNEYRLTVSDPEGRVHEIDSGVHEIDPRGSSRWTGEGPADGPEGSKKEGNKKKDSETTFVQDAWAVFLEELGGNGRQPQLTDKRRKKLAALHEEQLAGSEDPVAEFRAVVRELKASDHHMSNRDWQMPESFLRNPERRERWTLKALEEEPLENATSRRALDAYDGEES